jgi:cytochrome c biogenesis protein CcmG, thiol:disulfide interchange protein DsbE
MSSQRQAARKQSRAQGVVTLVLGLGLILIAFAGFLAIPKVAQEVRADEMMLVVPMEVNYPARAVSLLDLDGNPVSFDDYAGQVILYNAWATWCPPCKAEMPVLQAYYEKHRSKGFVIIAIEDGLQGNVDVKDFVADYGLTFPVWPDPEFKVSRAYAVSGLPASFVIDREGQVRLAWSGEISMAALEKYVTPLLSE